MSFYCRILGHKWEKLLMMWGDSHVQYAIPAELVCVRCGARLTPHYAKFDAFRLGKSHKPKQVIGGDDYGSIYPD